jgi:hypothetical protein
VLSWTGVVGHGVPLHPCDVIIILVYLPPHAKVDPRIPSPESGTVRTIKMSKVNDKVRPLAGQSVGRMISGSRLSARCI